MFYILEITLTLIFIFAKLKNDQFITNNVIELFGWWRSPVAHSLGVGKVASSNLVHPTEEG